MIVEANIKSITVAVMKVPCCNGLIRLVETALQNSNRDIPVEVIVIDIEGNIIKG